MKIFFYFLRPYDELPYAEKIAEELGMELGYTTEYPSPDNYELARGYDAISVTPCDMSAPVLEQFASLGVRYITCRSIGYDHIDLRRAEELGLRVSNVSYPPEGVANFAIMLMLMCCRKAVPILDRARIQDFTLRGKIGREISTMTIGVIGTGRIGTTVLRHLSGFGSRLLCYDLYQNAEAASLAEYTDLDTLLGESDIITLHTNVTEENYHLLDEAAFSKMKDQVILINTARGKLIDSDALISALESGKVGAAALDVLENENGLYYYDRVGDVIENRELAVLSSFPNVMLPAHTAFYTEQAVEYMVRGCFMGAYLFERGEENPQEVAYHGN